MRIIFIHSGKNYHSDLGPHYSPLIRHSLHLLPIKEYLQLTVQEKNKYRSIQSLSRGCIIGMALIDESYWFTSNNISNPWAHGPYCYHILDALRLIKPIECRGQMGVWRIPQSIKKEIISMTNINNKINEWMNKYHIINHENIYSALTIMQPFAEAIIRKIKNVENRGYRLFPLSKNDGIPKGCRLCIGGKQNDFDYKKYGKQFKNTLEINGHYKLSKYASHSKWNYHKTATVIQCQCKQNKKMKKRNNINIGKKKEEKKNGGNNRMNTNKSKKKKPIKAKPLPFYDGMTKRRKPPRNRGKGRGNIRNTTNNNNNNNNKISSYYKRAVDDELYQPQYNDMNGYRMRKYYDLREKKNGNDCLEQLKAMGYDEKIAMKAADKFINIEDAIDYLEKLQFVQNTENMGFSDKLNVNTNVLNTNNGNIVKRIKVKENNRKRRKMNDEDMNINMNKKKKRKLMNKYNEYEQFVSSSDYNEDSVMKEALKASQKTYDNELKVRTAINRSKYHGSSLNNLPLTNMNGDDAPKRKYDAIDLTVSDNEDTMDHNGNRKKKLSSMTMNKTPRRRW